MGGTYKNKYFGQRRHLLWTGALKLDTKIMKIMAQTTAVKNM